ncbi:MAG TPA: glycosyl hydrolase family 8 [Chitinispirillaceae bacterium]|nr:glycosyl hydrolase family 8 [Chitinispirillaceae bacterium]
MLKLRNVIVLSGFFFSTVAAQAPKYPFPQNVVYPYGVKSTKISNDFVKSWYNNWKTKYLQVCNSIVRPGVDPLTTSLVEAQGFSMVAVAYMGDKETFDKLYEYYKLKVTTEGCGLMGWKNNCAGFVDRGSATDGDIDVACALVVATWQWPDGGYKEKAKSTIDNLRKRMITTCSGKLAVYPGCGGGSPWGGCNETDISYYTPAFFRYFADVSGDESWKKLADDTQLIRDAAANSKTGLVPDWQSVDGRAGSGQRKGYYSFDAIRSPYKQTMDYLWHGTKAAGDWAKKLSTWANGVGVGSLKDEYNLDGSSRGSNHNMAAVGSFAVSAMANTQQIADAFATEVLKFRDDYWYSGYLGNLYLLALTGNMWTPEIVEKQSTIIRQRRFTGNSHSQQPVIQTMHRQIKITGITSFESIVVTALDGKTVSSAQVSTTADGAVISTSGIQSGCYILRIITTTNVQPLVHIVSVM